MGTYYLWSKLHALTFAVALTLGLSISSINGEKEITPSLVVAETFAAVPEITLVTISLKKPAKVKEHLTIAPRIKPEKEKQKKKTAERRKSIVPDNRKSIPSLPLDIRPRL